MRKKALVMAMGLLFLGVAYSSLSRAASGGGVAILSFKTLFPLASPFIGGTQLGRGIIGAGAQWAITHGSGELHVDGRLKVRTSGLVVVSTGMNPVTMFQSVVSCIDGTGSISNVATDPYPADAGGHSEVNTHVTLPSPCVAPVIFVAIPAGGGKPQRWIAVTGK